MRAKPLRIMESWMWNQVEGCGRRGDFIAQNRRKMENVAKWVNDNGGFVEASLEFRVPNQTSSSNNVDDEKRDVHSHRHRSVFAGKAMRSGHLLLRLPQQLLLKPSNCRIAKEIEEWTQEFQLTSWEQLM